MHEGQWEISAPHALSNGRIRMPGRQGLRRPRYRGLLPRAAIQPEFAMKRGGVGFRYFQDLAELDLTTPWLPAPV